MNILLITPTYFPGIGGGENYISNLAKELLKHHKVSVITSSEKSYGKKIIKGINVYYCSKIKAFGTEIISPIEMNHLLRKIKPDIIHSSGPSIIADLSFVFSRINKIPLVLTYHADLNFSKRISRVYNMLDDKIILKNIDRIIVTSKKYFKILKGRGIAKDRLQVIPVGVEYSRFNMKQNKKAIRKNLNLLNEKIILFVGQLNEQHEYKRLDLLLESLKIVTSKISNLRLIIVGRGNLLSKYQKLVKSLALDNYVIFLTEINDNELPKIYSIADLFVLPSSSKQEGFGIVILEAMASGVPVLISDKIGSTSLIKETNSGLIFKANDIIDLSNKIIHLFENSSLYLHLKRNGIEFSRKFNWKNVAKKIENVYSGILRNTIN